MRVANDGPNVANLSYSTADTFVAHVVRCADGALSEDSYLDLSQFFVRSNSDVRVVARRMEGALLPRDLRVGSRWSARFEGAAETAQAGGVRSEVKVEGIKEAVATETVTTAAGSFPNALKVKATYVIKTKMLAPAVMDLPEIRFEGTEWWAPGKGLVKSVSGVAGQSIDVEAARIQTP